MRLKCIDNKGYNNSNSIQINKEGIIDIIEILKSLKSLKSYYNIIFHLKIKRC